MFHPFAVFGVLVFLALMGLPLFRVWLSRQ